MGLLRLLLAMSIVIAHSTPIFGLTLTGSVITVQSFFIISGFYMSFVLNEKYSNRNNSYFLFITNRLMKLYPPYWLILILIIIFAFGQYYFTRVVSVYGGNFARLTPFYMYFGDMNGMTKLYLLFTNIFILGQDALFFLGLNLKTGSLFFTHAWQITYPQLHNFLLLPAAWVISLEMYFYVSAPFIVRKSVRFILLLLVASFAIRWYLSSRGLYADPWDYRFFPTELAFFLLGNISYRLYKVIQFSSLVTIRLLFIFVMFIICTIFYNIFPLLNNGIVYLCLLFFVIPFIFIFTKNWKVDRYMSELSYLVYISHGFLLLVINFLIISLNVPYLQGNGLTVAVASLVFSILLYEIFLKRIDRFRQKRLVYKY